MNKILKLRGGVSRRISGRSRKSPERFSPASPSKSKRKSKKSKSKSKKAQVPIVRPNRTRRHGWWFNQAYRARLSARNRPSPELTAHIRSGFHERARTRARARDRDFGELYRDRMNLARNAFPINYPIERTAAHISRAFQDARDFTPEERELSRIQLARLIEATERERQEGTLDPLYDFRN